ncbi:hypothetical protein NL676_024799 [Syzygium grande]|nr:hypothetical protein NL676_024799 [Syzygium grande]
MTFCNGPLAKYESISRLLNTTGNQPKFLFFEFVTEQKSLRRGRGGRQLIAASPQESHAAPQSMSKDLKLRDDQIHPPCKPPIVAPATRGSPSPRQGGGAREHHRPAVESSSYLIAPCF